LDPARKVYVEHRMQKQIEEILVINGEPIKTLRSLQSPTPARFDTISRRAQNPVYYGHFCARRNWNQDARPSLNQKRTDYGFIDTDTYEFFVPNNHTPMLSEEDYAIVVQMNTEYRQHRQRGALSCHSMRSTPGKKILSLSPEQLLTDRLLKLVACRSRCGECGKKMSAQSVVTKNKARRYYYISCRNPQCKKRFVIAKLDAIVAGLTLALADQAARVQAGELPVPSANGAELVAINEHEELKEGLLLALRRSPDNRVLRNELKKVEQQLKALREPAALAPSLEGLKAHQRFRHPRALEPGAWLELLSMNLEMATEVLLPIKWINLRWTAGVKPKRGPTPKHGVEVESIELFDQF